jgi:excisionase family DNA binding protein
VAEAGGVNTPRQLARHAELFGAEKISRAAASTLMSSPLLSVGLANSIPTGCCQPSTLISSDIEARTSTIPRVKANAAIATSLTGADVLSLSEAARLLGIPRSTVADLARRGDLPAVKLGKRWVFRRSYLEAATRPPGTQGAWRPAPGP